MDILFRAAARWIQSNTFNLHACAMIVQEIMIHDELVLRPCGYSPVDSWYCHYGEQIVIPTCAAHLRIANPEKWSVAKGWHKITCDEAEVFLTMRS